MKTVLIVDDQCLFRMSLAAIVKEIDPNTQIIERTMMEAGNLHMIQNFDLVILDSEALKSTEMTCEDLLTRISVATNVLIFTMAKEDTYAQLLQRQGAKSIVPKSASRLEVIAAVSAVLGGDYYISQKGHKYLWDTQQSLLAKDIRFSDRERQVLALLLQGKLTKEIASILQIRRNTISTYKGKIFRKMNVTSVLGLVRKMDLANEDNLL